MHYFLDKTFQDMVNLVLTFLSVIIVPLIKWFIQRYGNAPDIRKYRFEKIPASEKERLLARIDKLATVPLTKNVQVRIQLCYEQMGMYLPTWCCDKLICFISDKNISSVDNRLHCFLKCSFVGIFSDNNFIINTGHVHRACWIIAVFAVLSLIIQVLVWKSVTTPFLSGGHTALFNSFSLLYFIMISLTVRSILNLIKDIRLAVQFGRLFDAWLKSECEFPEQLVLF